MSSLTVESAAPAIEKAVATETEVDSPSIKENSAVVNEKKAKLDKKGKTNEDGDSIVEIAAPVSPKPAPFLQLWKYATRGEIMLNLVGLFFACGAGTTQPLLSLIFGRMVSTMITFFQVSKLYKANTSDPELTQVFNSAADNLNDDVSMNCIYLVVIGVAMFIGTYVYTLIFTYTSERISRRVREMYLRSVLRQDVAYFDRVGAGEVATRIETDTHLIQMGMSEKAGIAAMYIATFITGWAEYLHF